MGLVIETEGKMFQTKTEYYTEKQQEKTGKNDEKNLVAFLYNTAVRQCSVFVFKQVTVCKEGRKKS